MQRTPCFPDHVPEGPPLIREDGRGSGSASEASFRAVSSRPKREGVARRPFGMRVIRMCENAPTCTALGATLAQKRSHQCMQQQDDCRFRPMRKELCWSWAKRLRSTRPACLLSAVGPGSGALVYAYLTNGFRFLWVEGWTGLIRICIGCFV